jgi:hypothetical protein
MSAHYRSPMNYSNIHLESASDRVFYIYEVLLYFARNCLLLLVCAIVHAIGKHNFFRHLIIVSLYIFYTYVLMYIFM